MVSTTAALIGVGGVSWVVSASELDLVRATLRRMLGEVRINDVELGRFVKAFKASWSGLDGYRGQLRKVAEFSGLASVSDAVPALRLGYIERYERLLLTNFILLTDYFDAVSAGRETICIGPAGCVNPFADLSFD
jgi:hypothetical protein